MTPTRRLAASGSPVLLGLALACGGPEAPPPAEPAAEAVEYQVRGRLEALTEPGAEPALASILHEEIGAFAAADGEIVGMPSMVMDLELAPGLDTTGLAAGDPVAFTLEVSWSRVPPGRITAMSELPADTELELDDGSGHSDHGP